MMEEKFQLRLQGIKKLISTEMQIYYYTAMDHMEIQCLQVSLRQD